MKAVKVYRTLVVALLKDGISSVVNGLKEQLGDFAPLRKICIQ